MAYVLFSRGGGVGAGNRPGWAKPVGASPSRTTTPGPISPVTRSSTTTRARLTRWTTTLKCSSRRSSRCPLGFLLSRRGRRLAWQQVRKLRHVVGPHGQHLRAFDQIIRADAVKRVGLGVVRLRIVHRFLHAPKARHTGLVERNMVAAAFGAQARLYKSNFCERIQHAG